MPTPFNSSAFLSKLYDEYFNSSEGCYKICKSADGNLSFSEIGKQSITLGVAAVTLALTGPKLIVVTGDAGTNTLATITGGAEGEVYTFLFIDALVAITDNGTKAADTIDTAGAFVSTADATLQLVYDGTSWYEVARSAN